MDVDKIESTWICEYCGDEVESGLMNIVNHTCTQYAPNSSIQAHRFVEESKARAEKSEREFQPIFEKMTEEEHWELTLRTPIVACGHKMMMYYQDFKQQMIDKYKA